MNFSVCLIKKMRNICRACASVQAYLSFSFSYIYKIMFFTCSLQVHLSILFSEPLIFELICMEHLCNYVIAIISYISLLLFLVMCLVIFLINNINESFFYNLPILSG